MDFVVSGIITQVLQPQQGVSQRTQQPWQSQEFVLTYEQGQYPKSLCFRVFGADKLQQFAIQQNEMVTVHLNITCQQSSKGGFFNSIDCWKVDRQPMQGYQPQGYAPQPSGYAPYPPQPQTGAAPFPPQPQTAVPPQPAPAPFPSQQPVAQPTAPAQPTPQPQGNGQTNLPFPPAQ